LGADDAHLRSKNSSSVIPLGAGVSSWLSSLSLPREGSAAVRCAGAGLLVEKRLMLWLRTLPGAARDRYADVRARSTGMHAIAT